MKDLTTRVVQAVKSAIGPTDGTVLLHAPSIPESAWTYVKECLDTGWVSSAGSYVTKFEQLLAEQAGCARAVATVNGTAALEVCFRLAGVNRGDEVICPSLTFIATANAISYCGAIPHFVDVSNDRLSLCPEALKKRLAEIAIRKSDGTYNKQTGNKISALCLMHCFGHPGAIADIQSVCEQYEINFIEDAAESLGSYYRGKHTGRFGKLAAVSFNGNKIITTGGGGAILTDDEQLADRAKHLTTTAKVPHPYEFHHDHIGWNYRLPNLNAALGVAQLENLSSLLKAKRRLATLYAEAFNTIEEVSFLEEPADSASNYWLNAIKLKEPNEPLLHELLSVLNKSGYQCRPIWEPMHQLPMYAACPHGDLSVTEALKSQIINLPSSAHLVAENGVDQ